MFSSILDACEYRYFIATPRMLTRLPIQKCHATALRHLTGKERQERQAHPGRSKSSPTHTFMFPCCDGPESIAKFTSKQSSACRNMSRRKLQNTSEDVRSPRTKSLRS